MAFRIVKKEKPKTQLTFADVPVGGRFRCADEYLRITENSGINAVNLTVACAMLLGPDYEIDEILSPPPEPKRLTFADIKPGGVFVFERHGYMRNWTRTDSFILTDANAWKNWPSDDSVVEPASDYEWIAED